MDHHPTGANAGILEGGGQGPRKKQDRRTDNQKVGSCPFLDPRVGPS